MIKIIKYVVTIFLFLVINSCSKNDDNITNPKIGLIDFGDTTNAVLLSSFEYNARASLQGWQPWLPSDSLSALKYSFSNDVPNGGGHWSLKLQGVKYTEVSIDTNIILSSSDSLTNYILTFWAKGKGGVVFSIDAPDRGVVSTPGINCTSWTFFADTLFRRDVELNKLSVALTSWAQDSTAHILFDNVKVVKVR